MISSCIGPVVGKGLPVSLHLGQKHLPSPSTDADETRVLESGEYRPALVLEKIQGFPSTSRLQLDLVLRSRHPHGRAVAFIRVCSTETIVCD